MGDDARPAKRAKTSHSEPSGPGTKGPQSKKQSGQWGKRSKRQISASNISPGEVGIFVTCDKGNERKSLDELANLVDEYLETQLKGVVVDDKEEAKDDRVDIDGEHGQPEVETPIGNNGTEATVIAKANDIESDILAELADMKSTSRLHRNKSPPDPESGSAASAKLGLVTLDIPCVSFLRLPWSIDPVDVIYRICSEASENPHRQRSRYIKRMTPVSAIRKVLNEGLEECCEAVLPAGFRPKSAHSALETKNSANHSQPDEEDGRTASKQGWKFAIRPTIRNNDKLSRDGVIKLVADKVAGVGKTDGVQHKVDLKGWEKCVLVDVYRNVVGMSVIGVAGDVNDHGEVNGFQTIEERWKRFNLSEIYAEARRKVEKVQVEAAKEAE